MSSACCTGIATAGDDLGSMASCDASISDEVAHTYRGTVEELGCNSWTAQLATRDENIPDSLTLVWFRVT